MEAKCNTGCWDGDRCRRYYEGDIDDINPLEPIAMYFDFPPGTEVYHKQKAKNRNESNVITTRIVPGAQVQEVKKDTENSLKEKVEEKADDFLGDSKPGKHRKPIL